MGFFLFSLDKTGESSKCRHFRNARERSTSFSKEEISMYAIVETGGKQYKTQPGEVLRVEKLPGNVGDPVAFDKVLMLGTEDEVRVGSPLVDGARVTGRIINQDKGRKIVVFKFKRRKRYRLKKGHRQLFTAVQIDAIEA